MNPENLEAASENPVSENHFNPQRERARSGGCSGCMVVVCTTVIGMFAGLCLLVFVSSFFWPTGNFESRTKLLIEPRPVKDFMGNPVLNRRDSDMPHHKIMGSPLFVREMLVEADYFGRLKIFDGLPEDESLELVLRNLEVVPSGDQEHVYEIRFRSGDPQESMLIVNSLLNTYREYLEKAHSDELNIATRQRQEALMKVERMVEDAHSDYQKALSKSSGIKALESLGEGVNEIRTSMDRTDRELAQVAAKSKWVLDALEKNDRPAEIYWTLRNTGEIKYGNDEIAAMLEAERKALVAQQQKKIKSRNESRNKSEGAKSGDASNDGTGQPDDDLKEIEKQIADVEKQLKQWESTSTMETQIRLYLLSNERRKIELAKTRENALKKYDELNDLLSKGRMLEHQLAELKRQYLHWRTLHEKMADELALFDPDLVSRITKPDRDGYSILILERPEEGVPVSDGFWIVGLGLTMIGGFMGLFFGVVISMGRRNR